VPKAAAAASHSLSLFSVAKCEGCSRPTLVVVVVDNRDGTAATITNNTIRRRRSRSNKQRTLSITHLKGVDPPGCLDCLAAAFCKCRTKCSFLDTFRASCMQRNMSRRDRRMRTHTYQKGTGEWVYTNQLMSRQPSCWS
jgi:hypothetical protein